MKITKFIAFPAALALMATMAFGGLWAINSASAQTAGPRVAIQLLSTGLTSPLAASSTDAVVARLVLDTTGSSEPVRINSLPFILTNANGAVASHLQNCEVVNEANANTALSNGMTMQSGLNNVALNSSLILQANTVTTLSLRCDVSGDLVTGGTYTFSMNTANLSAVGANTGLAALVTVRGAVVVPPVVNPPVVTPGLPTTGAGGEATQNIALILGSVILAIMGFGYAVKAEKKF